MKKRTIRLYNVMFPIWYFFFLPPVWLVMLPVNFLFDSLVLFGSARHQRLPEPRSLWKKHILPIWIIGFLSDIAGAGLTFLLFLLFVDTSPLNLGIFPGSTLISIPGTILAGFLIYFLNRKLTFRHSPLDPAVVHKLCLHLALFTAPYTMLIPLYW